MSHSLFRLQGVTRHYGSRQVLNIDHLQIQAGEILALVGPSGAGKSTLLRLLNFLESPTQGQLTFQNVEIGPGQTMPLALRRRVTMVFQRPVLLRRTVAQNVRYGLQLRGRQAETGRVADVLEQVGLTHLAQAQARTLSGGEAQRVALARAMVFQPDVLLMDEPTANLDPYNVGLMERIVQELNQENRVTVVLVTHNVFQARRLAHRVALMLEGRIVEVAPVVDFFEQPRDLRTAAFVRGEMVY